MYCQVDLVYAEVDFEDAGLCSDLSAVAISERQQHTWSLLDRHFPGCKKIHLVKVSPKFKAAYGSLGQAIYSYLCYCDHFERSTPTVYRIAKEIGAGHRSTKNKLAKMQAAGLLTNELKPAYLSDVADLFQLQKNGKPQYIQARLGLRLSWSETYLLFMLYSLAKGSDRIAGQSVKGLAKLCHCDRKTARKALRSLEDARLTYRERKGDRFDITLLPCPDVLIGGEAVKPSKVMRSSTTGEPIRPTQDPRQEMPHQDSHKAERAGAREAPRSLNASARVAAEKMSRVGIPASIVQEIAGKSGEDDGQMPLSVFDANFSKAREDHCRNGKADHCGNLLKYNVGKWFERDIDPEVAAWHPVKLDCTLETWKEYTRTCDAQLLLRALDVINADARFKGRKATVKEFDEIGMKLAAEMSD